MMLTKEILIEQAEIAKMNYKRGQITRAEAKLEIQPYIDLFNKKSKEIAEKYNQRAKKISFSQYVR